MNEYSMNTIIMYYISHAVNKIEKCQHLFTQFYEYCELGRTTIFNNFNKVFYTY